jgi:hypothetical protein
MNPSRSDVSAIEGERTTIKRDGPFSTATAASAAPPAVS